MSFTLPFTKEMKVIELGGGTVPVFRPNLDVRAAPNVDIVADFDEPLPIKTKNMMAFLASFALSMYPGVKSRNSWKNVIEF